MTKSAQTKRYRVYAHRDAGTVSGDACKTSKDYVLRKLLAGLLLPIWEITKPIPPVQMEEWAPVICLRLL
jgi:hypothetical protein